MKKNTFIPLLLLIIMASHAYGVDFIIKLASYSNKESLIKKINLLDTNIKENIMLVKENNLYKLFSKSLQNKETALKMLPAYQKIFSDAYIMVDRYSQVKKEDIHIDLALKEDINNSINTKELPIAPIHTLMQPKIDKAPPLSFREILENKTFYLCPQQIHSHSEKILIEAKFGTDSVSYKTLMGNVPSMQRKYTIQKNRLYIITNNKISISQFNTIDKIFFEYMIVSRWYRGKKIHQMRYYKKEADARSYIDSISLN